MEYHHLEDISAENNYKKNYRQVKENDLKSMLYYCLPSLGQLYVCHEYIYIYINMNVKNIYFDICQVHVKLL